MADIFSSYGREDVVQAHGLAEALSGLGWSVWWDDSIRAGSPFDTVIDEQLDAAGCVIVVWSPASVSSNWVRAEASAASEQGKLVPVTFHRKVRLPVLFRQLNVVHLTSTDLSSPTSAATGLLADIAAFTGKVPKGIQLGGGDSNRDLRSSGAQRITAGDWQITSRMIGMRAESTLTLRPDGNVLGRSSWFISSAELAGRWQFDPAEQVLHLELSGGTMEGLHAKPVRIIRWDSADSAECTMEGRRARIQRVFPART